MHSPSLNPGSQLPPNASWARLIPGAVIAFPPGKKAAQGTRSLTAANVSEFTANTWPTPETSPLASLLPEPFTSHLGWKCFRSVTADISLVGLNWLLIGAMLVPLREVFPSVWVFRYAQGSPLSLLGIAALHAALITLMGYSERLYATGSTFQQQIRILAKSVSWPTTLLCVAYLMQGAPWPRCVLIMGAGALHFGVLLEWRRQIAKQAADASHPLRNVLVVGAGSAGRRIASYLDVHPELGRAVYGLLDDDKSYGNGVIGRVGDLARLARRGFVDEVILAGTRDRGLTSYVLREARRLRLDATFVPDLLGCQATLKDIEQIGDSPFIPLHVERLPAMRLALKRGLDVIGAGLALAALSPLLAIIAALIRLDSPGPVIYRAPRAGRKGHLFRCYKFRTMVKNADALKEELRRNNERSGPFFKLAEDPRITRVGHWLRRYSLDELPQLWNVLKGDMSLVGPRPHPVDDYASYELEHLARLDVTPGITGLWQVTARRDPSFRRGMELDREYIHTWSLVSDLRILLRTFITVARGSGQ